MMNWKMRCLALLGLTAAAAATAASGTDTAAIATVQRLAKAIAQSDVPTFETLWSIGGDVSAIENGAATYGRETIIKNLSAEMREARDVSFDLLNMRATMAGRLGWVTFEYHLKAKAGERTLDALGAGTATIRMESGQYRIVHLHMSNKAKPRPVVAGAGAAMALGNKGLVLVIGATGRSGSALLSALKADSFTRVRALVRDPAAAKAKLGDGVELVQGDVRDPASLAKAMEGVQYIVSSLGSNTFNDPTNSPEHVDYEGVRNIAVAAKAAGVQHYVQVSSLGVTNPSHPLNRFGKVMDWKLKGENAIRSSGVAYTIVRAGGLGDEAAGLSGIRALQGDKLDTGRIPRADVATVCVKALGDAAARGKTFEIVSGAPGASVDWSGFFTGLSRDP